MEVVDAFVAVVVVVVVVAVVVVVVVVAVVVVVVAVVAVVVVVVAVVEDACNISSRVYATKNIKYISISCNTVYTHVITIVVTIFICIRDRYA